MPAAENSRSFLSREKCIQYSGFLLALSPFGNFLWSAFLSGVRHWYYPRTLIGIAGTISPFIFFLWASAFVAGWMMLKGKRSSWTFTLSILGMNIVFGIITFKRDSHISAFQPSLAMLVNVALFSLVYAQEFHQKLEKKVLDSCNSPFQFAIQSELKVRFDQMGDWARVTQISNDGIRIQSYAGNAPEEIERRIIELALSKDLAVKARFSARIENDFVFRYLDMNPVKKVRLARWASKLAKQPHESLDA
jgi:hypothetical protein